MRGLVAFLLALLACAVHPMGARASDFSAEAVWTEQAVWEGPLPGDALDTGADYTRGTGRFVTMAPAERLADAQAVPLPDPAVPQVPRGIAAFGPFRVLDPARAALVDVTDARSPAAFSRMLAAFPGIATVDMIDCPGTEDDRANLALGRMIRARGVAMHVPERGFVGSGAVELFLAGARRSAEPGAEFAVHSWQDDQGREPRDFAPNAPEHRIYIDYYRAMGLSGPQAAAFYAMTNSAPFAGAKWLTAAQMREWVSFDR